MCLHLIKRLIVCLFMPILLSGFPAWADGVADQALSAREFKSMLDSSHNEPDVVLLDIRTPSEFADGHITGAVNIDYYSRDFVAQLRTLDRNKKYLIYCRSGNRTGRSLPIFNRMGFDRVWHLEAGLLGWVRARYPLARQTG